MEEEPGDAKDRLRAHGLRVTLARLAVLDFFEPGVGHLDVRAVQAAIRPRCGELSMQTVYNVLDALAGAGLLRRIELPFRPTMFERRVGDNHHHGICRGCDTIFDIDCPVGGGPCLTPDTTHGFAIDEAEIVYWGRCARCRHRC